MNILVTGGAGYIGSHVTDLLLKKNKVVVFDNLEKGHKEAIPKRAIFVKDKLSNVKKLDKIFKGYNIESVIHLAAYSEVEESMKKPNEYIQNNVTNTANLITVMLENRVKDIIFSSSAAVYGIPKKTPITEEHPTKHINTYSLTKLLAEELLESYSRSGRINYVSLRYFNVAGASKNLGEDHRPETHLIPVVLQTALGKRDHIDIFGTDYETKDGTCIRDYIHVLDIAQAHVLALESLKNPKSRIYNLGSETGYSVKQIIDTAKKITKVEIPTKKKDRREGDPPILVASSEKIKRELGWKPIFSDLQTIIKTAWDWYLTYPDGY